MSEIRLGSCGLTNTASAAAEPTCDSVNGIDVAALRATADAVRQDRALGEVTFSLSGVWAEGCRVDTATGALTQAGTADHTRVGRFLLSSDEPLPLLGTDTAVSPAEYIIQALAGCYTVTLVANAAARGIKLNAYKLDLEIDFDLGTFLGVAPEEAPGAREIRVTVALDAPAASRAELQDLVATVERLSPVRDTLASPVSVLTTLA